MLLMFNHPKYNHQIDISDSVTSMLVTEFGEKYVGDKFKMLVTDLKYWWPI